MFQQRGNRLYEFLSTPFRAVGEAMRTNRRHDSSARARLSWSGAGQDHTARARLLDISRAGASLLTSGTPPPAGRVRLRLVDPELTPWIEAEVLGAEPKARGRHRVRLRFADPCPNVFLRAAVLGPPALDEAEVSSGGR